MVAVEEEMVEEAEAEGKSIYLKSSTCLFQTTFETTPPPHTHNPVLYIQNPFCAVL